MGKSLAKSGTTAGEQSVTTGNALLVYPEFPGNSYWNFRQMHRMLLPLNRYGYPKAMMPPLGLLCIIGPIRKRYGEGNIRLVDMNVQPLERKDLEWADDVFISGMLAQSESYGWVAGQAKALGKRTIGGGPCVSAGSPHLDHIFLNESEHTLGPFLDGLLKGSAGKIQEGPLPAPEDFFRPDYSAVNLADYATIPIQFSRGCPHDCEFCDITIRYGRKMRTRSSGDFLADLQQLFEEGWRGQVFIIDDNFVGKPEAALALLRELEAWQVKRGFPFEFFTQATVLLAEERYEELLKAFAPAGFSMIFLGIETPNEESLRETSKLHNLRPGKDLAGKINRIREIGGMLILGGFVIGFDSDTPDIFDRHIRFINEIRIPTPMIALLSPLPETKLEARLKKEGRLFSGSSGAVASGLEVSFKPKNFSRSELVAGYKKVLREVYLDMDSYYSRCLDSLKDVSRPHLIFKADELLGMFRLLYHEGFAGRHRGPFWKYVAALLMRHPLKVPYGMRWAAYGLHYRILTDKLVSQEGEVALEERECQLTP